MAEGSNNDRLFAAASHVVTIFTMMHGVQKMVFLRGRGRAAREGARRGRAAAEGTAGRGDEARVTLGQERLMVDAAIAAEAKAVGVQLAAEISSS